MASLLLIDGSGFFWRAYHAFPNIFRRDGTPVNAVQGIASLVLKPVCEKNLATHVAVVYDHSGPNFRHTLHPEYKANRPVPPAELTVQAPLVREVVRAFGIKCIEIPGFEADDTLATLARRGREAGMSVTISSSDKDLMQLVCDEVCLFNHQTKKIIRASEVEAKFGVRPDQVAHIQALSGDTADNIPGVPSIGPKTAATLINRFGSIQGVLDGVASIERAAWRKAIEENREAALLSYELARLRDDVPLDFDLEDLRMTPPLHTVRRWLMDNDLPTHLAPQVSRRFPDWMPENGAIA